jgi:aspartyl-tRNA synthetase
MVRRHMVVLLLALTAFIAFPKNNAGRDVMLDAPATIDEKQFEELQIKLDLKK